MDIGGRNR
ncbi:hypothetical protein ACOMHN_028553 [Nucella lapillus]